MKPINTTMQPTEWAMLLTLSVLWGGSFFFIGVAVREFPPFTLVLLRLTFAALTLHAISAVFGQRMRLGWKLFGAYTGLAVINNAMPFCLISWGQLHIASGLAAILNATTPLFGLVVAHYLTHDEKMTPAKVVGLIVGFAGIVVMIGLDALRGLGINVLAQLAVIAAAVCYAFGGVLSRRLQVFGLTSLQASTGLFTAGALVQLPAALIVDQPWTLPMPGWHAWAALITLGVISTGVAYIMYFRVLATAGAVNIMLVTFLVPVTSILLGISFLDETLHARELAGMALIGFGLMIIDGRTWKWLRRSGTQQPAR